MENGEMEMVAMLIELLVTALCLRVVLHSQLLQYRMSRLRVVMHSQI
jgi:hypothetical protein